MKATTMTTTAVALGIALALTGCTPTSDPAEPPDPAPAVTAAPVETPAPAPVETEAPAPVLPATGETIPAEAADTLPDGYRAYPMADGTLIALKEGDPLPAPVVADIAAPVSAMTATVGKDDSGSLAVTDAAKRAFATAIGKAGINAVVVYRMWSGEGIWRYQMYGAPIIKPAPVDKATVMAAAQAHVAAQTDPTKWTVIDATGE